MWGYDFKLLPAKVLLVVMSASGASTFDNNNATEGTAASSVNTTVTVVGSLSGAVFVALVVVIAVMAKTRR